MRRSATGVLPTTHGFLMSRKKVISGRQRTSFISGGKIPASAGRSIVSSSNCRAPIEGRVAGNLSQATQSGRGGSGSVRISTNAVRRTARFGASLRFENDRNPATVCGQFGEAAGIGIFREEYLREIQSSAGNRVLWHPGKGLGSRW